MMLLLSPVLAICVMPYSGRTVHTTALFRTDSLVSKNTFNDLPGFPKEIQVIEIIKKAGGWEIAKRELLNPPTFFKTDIVVLQISKMCILLEFRLGGF